MKILISGGHLTPALAFIDYVKSSHPEDQVFFAGRLFSKSNREQMSVEAEQVKKRGLEFIELETGKFVTNKPSTWPKNLWLLLKGLFTSFMMIGKIRPQVILTFGGYLGVPLAMAGALWNVPIVTHEQTHSLGFANKIIAKIAKYVAVSHADSLALVPSHKGVVTGNIIRQNVLAYSDSKPSWFKTTQTKPVIYITGGSQGSEIINATVAQALKHLTKKYIIIHQCGGSTKNRSYQNELLQAKRTLPKSEQAAYFPREWIDEAELAWIYSHSRGIVSRSGANTTQELARRALPSIFIPLPFSRREEQLENANYLVAQKMALLLLQKDLNPSSLVETLEKLLAHRDSIVAKLKQLKFQDNSAQLLYQLLVKVV